MKRFMAIYLGSPNARSGWDKLSEAERKERQQTGVAAWRGWMETHRESIVESGRTRRALPTCATTWPPT